MASAESARRRAGPLLAAVSLGMTLSSCLAPGETVRLFQPQDHPAREMQDTFYMGRPATCGLPDDDVLQAVRVGGADHVVRAQKRDPLRGQVAQRTFQRAHIHAL